MRTFKLLLAALALAAGQAHAAVDDAEDWQFFGRVLSLVQSVVHSAAQSDDPRAMDKSIGSLLSGENADANRIAKDLLDDTAEDIPPAYRGVARSLANDLAVLARKEQARRERALAGSFRGHESALQARKDLTAMGLRYYDSSQFLEAIRREDVLAAELFLAGRGVDPSAKDASGLSALDLARKRNNRRLIELLASAGSYERGNPGFPVNPSQPSP